MAEGYTVAELLTRVADLLGLTEGTATHATRIYQAITAAGRTAATWPGTDWWWLYRRGNFLPVNKTIKSVALSGAVRSANVVTITTTAAHGLVAGQRVRIDGVTDSTMDGAFSIVAAATTTTFTYDSVGDDSTSGAGTVYSNEYILRTVNSNAFAAMRTVSRIYFDDDHHLKQIGLDEYADRSALGMKLTLGDPLEYAISEGIVGPVLHLLPTPNTSTRLFLDYKIFHKKIAAAGDANLIVPMEFQEGVYVDGSAWLLRRDVGDTGSLKTCPGFMEALDRMQGSEHLAFDNDPSTKFDEPDQVRGAAWPNSQVVVGGIVHNWGSVT